MVDFAQRNDESRTPSIAGAIVVPHPPLIIPDVGRGDEIAIASTINAYRRATRTLHAMNPDVLVIASPHAPLLRDSFHVTTDDALFGDMAQFRAREARIYAECDVDLAMEIIQQALNMGLPCTDSEGRAEGMDHATFVPLHFMCEAAAKAADGEGDEADASLENYRLYGEFDVDAAQPPCPIVRVGLSGLSPEAHRHFGRAIAYAAEALGRRVGFIASGDLSHRLLAEGPYGFRAEGPEFDERIGEIFSSGDLEALFDFDEDFCEAAAECGLRSFQVMAGAIEGLGFTSRLLSNEGPFGVGYGVATLMPEGVELVELSADEELVCEHEPGGALAGDAAEGGALEGDAAEGGALAGGEPVEEPPGIDAHAHPQAAPAQEVLSSADAQDGPGLAYAPVVLADPETIEEYERAFAEQAALTELPDAPGDAEGDGDLLLLIDYDSERDIDPCVRLARLAVETFTSTGEFATLPDDVPYELLGRRAGVFVSLHENGELRGCIGTASPVTESIAAEIMRNAVAACCDDPRFEPVRPDELDSLAYSVDVLGAPERIATSLDLDPGRYGVIVSKGWKKGLLLPALEGVDSVERQLSVAKEKAGIHPADNDVELERFEVERHTLGGEPRLG